MSLKFCLCKAFAKRNINTKSKHNFELCFDVLVVLFLFLSLMTESAGTAQGVDVALPFVARVQILFSTMVRPYCHRKRWNSARS